MKKFATLAAALAGCLLLISLLYAVVAMAALRPDAYPQGPPFDEMAAELVAYLQGELADLSPSLFTQRERLHMADVLGLFQGAKVLATAGCIGGLALAATALVWGGRERLGHGLIYGFAVLAGLGAVIGLWAAIDFDGWFIAMHEMVFTNDLWLLDPAESMLIRMLPTEFFMDRVLKIGGWFAAGAGLFVAVAAALRMPWGREQAS